MKVHRSLMVEKELWDAMESRADSRGFASTSSYLRFLVQEDLLNGSVDEMEERLVSSLSKVQSQVQSIGTMHQASFATIWALIEMVLHISPEVHAGVTAVNNERLAAVRLRIAKDVRGNVLLKGLMEA